jgi:hypothetical protein
VSPLWLAVLFSSLWLGVGWALRAAVVPQHQHESPNLHEGVWELTTITGHGPTARAQWQRFGQLGTYTRAVKHEHRPYYCTIGPGIAHTDRCLCGAERYGRYGAWY